MAIRLNEEHQVCGNGLGYQMTAYALMRSLCNSKGLTFSCAEDGLYCLKNTFTDIVIDEIDQPGIQGTNSIEIQIDESFDDILERVENGSTLFGYPTPMNSIDLNQIDNIKQHFKFREEIYQRCLEWKNKKFGDSEIISMHIRKGDFVDPQNGMFVIGEDYYLKALEMMPKDTPVLIFTNDKSDIFYMEKIQDLISNGDSSGREYTLVEDIVSDRSSAIDDWSHMILTQSSPQFGLYDSDPELNSLYLEHLVDFDGKSNYRYDYAEEALIEYTKNLSESDVDFVEAITGKSYPKTSLVYTDTTQYKIDNHLYNYSFDLCLMSMCNYHIAANSLYGFWGINLSDSKKIIYPKYWSQGMVDSEEPVCDNPSSCRPGFQCNQDTSVVSDLGGLDQTKSFLGKFMDERWIGLENPDPRAQ